MPHPQQTRRMIATEAGALAVHDIGSGPRTIVLWPSIFADHHIHLRLAAALDGQARTLLIDGPGHGGSGPAPDGHDIASHARAMARIVDEAGLSRAVVGGTSWGGLVGAELALIRPELVSGVVLMNLPVRMGSSGPGLQDRLIALGARHILRTGLFRDGVARSFFARETLAQRPEALATFHATLRRADAAALSDAVASVMLRDAAWRGAALAERLARIAAPVLMVAGRHDDLYPLADQRQAAAGLRKGRLVEVGGRHISPVDAPEAVAEAVHAFLADLQRA